ncbi:hypothetical protein IQ03_04522 [Gemmobacter caeni]|uniref:Uncharacterized protein n=1 Tax=Gemmobacter caeni TaxID=589035 RepID=A0A2T6AP64_9RHOB|nr:hypothetical protein C8N34_12144 [Gemmobacter caeni]TWI93761.1 hypothetical protein IQ03_04522 [Gemmobacter caeni]
MAILSFSMEDGSVLRLLVSAQSQLDLAEVLAGQHASECACTNCGTPPRRSYPVRPLSSLGPEIGRVGLELWEFIPPAFRREG